MLTCGWVKYIFHLPQTTWVFSCLLDLYCVCEFELLVVVVNKLWSKLAHKLTFISNLGIVCVTTVVGTCFSLSTVCYLSN